MTKHHCIDNITFSNVLTIIIEPVKVNIISTKFTYIFHSKSVHDVHYIHNVIRYSASLVDVFMNAVLIANA